MSKCVYRYKGQEYNRTEALKAIRDNVIEMPALDQEGARQWLNDTLGLTDDQVSIVKGLIDGGAHGQFLEDGSILLSDQLEGSQYHEAFHRVVRMLLTDSEWQSIMKTFLQRKDAEQAIKAMAERYPGADRATLIEEVLAEEFMFYQLNDGNYKVPEPEIKTFFDWLLNLMRRMLGMDIKSLYDRIANGGYKATKPKTYKVDKANMIYLNGDFGIDTDIKRELVEDLFVSVMTQIAELPEGLHQFAEGKIAPEKFNEVVRAVIEDNLTNADYGMLNDEVEDVVELGKAIKADVDSGSSQLLREFKRYVEQFSLKLNIVESEMADNSELDDVDNEENQQGDNAFNQVSMEFDPRAYMSNAVKLFLGSIPKQRYNKNGELVYDNSPILRLNRPERFGKVTRTIYNLLAGLPKDPALLTSVLNVASKQVGNEFLNRLVRKLESGDQRFVEEFYAAFANNKYRLIKGVLEDGAYKMVDISDTGQTSVLINDWRNRMESNVKSNEELLDILRDGDRDDKIRALGLGVVLDLDLMDELSPYTRMPVFEIVGNITDYSENALRSGVDFRDLYLRDYKEENAVRGSLEDLASVVSQYATPLDLLVINAERKRVFPISKHTYQTQLIGTLNYIADEIKIYSNREERKEEGLKLLRKYAPHVLHVENYDPATGEIRSAWLRSIIADAMPIDLFLMDGITSNLYERHFSKVDETDYLAMYINTVLYTSTSVEARDAMLGFKHGDRKVIYGYRLDRTINQISVSTSEAIITDLVGKAIPYLVDEIRRIALHRDSTSPLMGHGISRVSKNITNLQAFNYEGQPFAFTKQEVDKMVKAYGSTGFQDTVKNVAERKIRQAFKHQADELLTAMREMQMLDNARDWRKEKLDYPAGIEKRYYEHFKGIVGSEEEAYKAIAAYVAGKYFFGFVEQMKLFNGNPYNYKSIIDFYKRAQMQSSTGTNMLMGNDIEREISDLNERDAFTIDGEQRVYGMGDLKRAGYQSEVVLQDQTFASTSSVEKNYNSPVDKRKKVGMARYLTELNAMRELEPLVGAKEAKRIATERGERAESMFGAYDENDGMSWVNMFFWREYMKKVGKWNDKKENTFQIELAVLRTKEAGDRVANTKVWVDANDNFYATKPGVSAQEVSIFDTEDIRKVKSDAKDSYLTDHTDYATILKPQYTGPLMPVDPLTVSDDDMRVNLIAGRKTAYAVLLPSMVDGTHLELLNKMMLKRGLDSVHMVSAAKYGTKDFGAFASMEATMLYDAEGNFNGAVIDEHLDKTVSWLDMAYQKDQVNVTTTPKAMIRNATQSVKTMLENMMVDGFPSDISIAEREAFREASNEEKRAMSQVFEVYDDYRTNLNRLVLRAVEEAENDIGDMGRIGEVLRAAAKNRAEPEYMMASIEAFLNDPTLEKLTSYERTEIMLYSIVTNSVVKIKRPGDGKPQMAASMWEPIGTKRKVVDGKITTEGSATSFYGIGADGNLTPASVILPLPPNMVPLMLRMFKTTNIMTAIEQYNALSTEEKIERKFIVKSLRIPNQQFSFNDVFVIGKFTSPLAQQFIVVPGEVVPKTDADFDLDKQQIYEFARMRDGSVPMPIDLTDNNDEAVWERLQQRRGLERVDLPSRSLIYEDDLTYHDYRQAVWENIQELKGYLKSLRQDYELDNPDGAINIFLADSLRDVAERYGLESDTIGELLDETLLMMAQGAYGGGAIAMLKAERSNISEMTEMMDEGTAVDGNLLRTAMEARNELVDMLRSRSELSDLVEEKLQQGIAVLNDIREQIKAMDIQAFRERYPEPINQTHYKVLHNALLDSEIKLLLNKNNAHKMVAAADDSYLSTIMLVKVLSKKLGVDPKVLEADLESAVMGGKINSLSLLSVPKNAERAIQMLASKANVGLVALAITHHNLMMADKIDLRETFKQEVEDGKGKVDTSSEMPIDGFVGNYTFSGMLDGSYRYILETLSTLLTSQVDGVNNPYAPAMNLNAQTLPVVAMMVRRGVDMETILYLINNPAVEGWVKYQNRHSSAVYDAGGLRTARDKQLNEYAHSLRAGSWRDVNNYLEAYRNSKVPTPESMILTKEKLYELLGGDGKGLDDSKVLAAYQLLTEQADSVRLSSTVLTPDTKGKRNRGHVVNFKKAKKEAVEDGIVDPGYLAGFLSPFYRGQEVYELLGKFYRLPHETLLDGIAEEYTRWRFKEADVERINQRVVTDFITFITQKFSPHIAKYTYEELLTGNDSFAHELANEIELMNKGERDYNYALDMLQVQLRMGEWNGEPAHAIKLTDRGVANTDLNDLYDDFQYLDTETQDKLTAVMFYQTGLMRSPFMLQEMVHVPRSFRAMSAAFDAVQSLNEEALKALGEEFRILWAINNAELLPWNRKVAAKGKVRYFRQTDKNTGEVRVYATEDIRQSYPAVGSMRPPRRMYTIPLSELEKMKVQAPTPTVESSEAVVRAGQVQWKNAEVTGAIEVSTKGDTFSKQFSAFNAKLADGRTIEEAYQLDVKGYRQLGYTVSQAKRDKGENAPIKMTPRELYDQYKALWVLWARQNPDKMRELIRRLMEAKVPMLTDRLAKDNVSQARALAEIINESFLDRNAGDTLYAMEAETKFEDRTVRQVLRFIEKYANVNLVKDDADASWVARISNNQNRKFISSARFNVDLRIPNNDESLRDFMNALPEEAAHLLTFWIKGAGEEKASTLYRGMVRHPLVKKEVERLKADPAYSAIPNYNYVDEAIGKLVVESIKAIEDGNANKENYSFIRRVLKLIKDALNSWFAKVLEHNYSSEDRAPFDAMATAILNGELSIIGLKPSNLKAEGLYYSILKPQGTTEVLDGMVELLVKYKKEFVQRFAEDTQIVSNKADQVNQLFKRDSKEDFLQRGDDVIYGTLSAFDMVAKKFPKNVPLNQNLNIYNIKESKKKNAKPREKNFQELFLEKTQQYLLEQDSDRTVMPTADFIKASNELLKEAHFLAFRNESAQPNADYLTYGVTKTFEHIPTQSNYKPLSDQELNRARQLTANLTEEGLIAMSSEDRNLVRRYLMPEGLEVTHDKISLRKSGVSYDKHSHFPQTPVAWGNLTYFYTNANSVEKDAVLLHEIQSDVFKILKDALKIDSETGGIVVDTPRIAVKIFEMVMSLKVNGYDRIPSNLNAVLEGLDGRRGQGLGSTVVLGKLWKIIEQFNNNQNPIALIQEVINLSDLGGGRPPHYVVVDTNKGPAKVQLTTLVGLSDINDYIRRIELLREYEEIQNGWLKSLIASSNDLAITLKEAHDLRGVVRQSYVEIVGNLLEDKRYMPNIYDLVKANPVNNRDVSDARFIGRMVEKATEKLAVTLAQIDTKTDVNSLRERIEEELEDTSWFDNSLELELEFYELGLEVAKRTNFTDTFMTALNIPAEEVVEYLNKAVGDQFRNIYREVMSLTSMVAESAGESDNAEIPEELIRNQLEYFNPLVHHLIQRVIAAKGRSFPIYFTGYEATLLTQGSYAKDTAAIYAGPEEVSKGLAAKKGPLFNLMSKVKGIRLEYVDTIPGLKDNAGGYRVILDDYNYTQPLLYSRGVQKPEPYRNDSSQYLKGKLEGEYMTVERGKLESDKKQLIAIFGQSMYSENLIEIAYKELIQNAFDAVKIAVAEGKYEQGRIDIITSVVNRTITIKDNGIGMSPEVVKKAFFAIGGTYKGEGIDNRLKSGGLGMAKMAFIFGSDHLRLETVKDGVRTIVDTPSNQIVLDNFDIITERTREPNGTSVTVTIPKTYTTAKGGVKEIYFSHANGIFKPKIFTQAPLIGPVQVFANGDSLDEAGPNWMEALKQQGKNYELFTTATTDYADIDIYIDFTEETFPRHVVLSSGLYQFTNNIYQPGGTKKIPFNVILDIKPNITTADPRYPFNNQREGFRDTITRDVKAMYGYIQLLFKKLEAEKLQRSFEGMFNAETSGLDVIRRKKKRTEINESDKLSSEELKKFIQRERKAFKQLTVDDGVVRSESGAEVATKEDYDTTFKPARKLKEISQYRGEVSPDKPVIHNNTTMFITDEGLAYMKEFANVMMAFKKGLLKTYGTNYGFIHEEKGTNKYDGKYNLENQLWGVSIDTGYKGVNVRPDIIHMLGVNPFSIVPPKEDVTVGAVEDEVAYIVIGLEHLIIHEMNHNFQRNEGSGFTASFVSRYAEVRTMPGYRALEALLYDLVERYYNTIIKHHEYWKQSENVERSFKGNELREFDAGERAERTEGLPDGNTDINEGTTSDDRRGDPRTGEAPIGEILQSKGMIPFVKPLSNRTDNSQSSEPSFTQQEVTCLKLK